MIFEDTRKLEITHYLVKMLGNENVLIDEPMKNHTSFKAGGNADLLVYPNNGSQLQNTIKYLTCLNAPYFVMGNGTNILVKDGGYKGVIVKIRDNLSAVSVKNNVVTAEAGALLSVVSKIAYENGLSGLEFAEGIPGTIGGGVAMNAGAYGGEIKDVLFSVTALDTNGNLLQFDNKGLEFSYRNSKIQRQRLICVSAQFKLTVGDKLEIKRSMDENKIKRTEKQPLSVPSAGSTFKRPKGFYAGKLIMDSGLSGYRIGGASVSEKHCGFVVNDRNAAASEIIGIIEFIQNKVYENFNVRLETEVKIIGEQP